MPEILNTDEPAQPREILNIDELGELLRMSRRQIYSMTETRTRTGAMKANPLPVLRINGNLRFMRSDILAWLQKTREAA